MQVDVDHSSFIEIKRRKVAHSCQDSLNSYKSNYCKCIKDRFDAEIFHSNDKRPERSKMRLTILSFIIGFASAWIAVGQFLHDFHMSHRFRFKKSP